MAVSLDEVQAGCFYEINPTKLSPKHPAQLKQIRILMVSEKTESSIAVRYPSLFSLRTYFNNGGVYTRRDTKRMPALDEKCVMDVKTMTTREVFVKRISGNELEEMKGVSSFWSSSSNTGGGGNKGAVSNKGLCWSELKSNSMVHWGKRRRVRFLSRHEEISNNNNNNNHDNNTTNTPNNSSSSYNLQLLSSSVQDEEENDQMDLKEEEKNGGGGGGDKGSERGLLLSQKSRKRNRNETKTMTVKNTRARRNQATNVGKRKIVKHSISRWSADRYKLAEQNMLKIMKEKGAVFSNPILRPELRAEARKLIGDTGLLDHLLKHMAGKLAPGGEERFRRRHNADGAMEYWLEAADLMNIRKEAGIQDLYWIPPPGWQPGDNPSQDPVCAMEIRDLKEQVDSLKRKMKELECEKQEGRRDLVLVTTTTTSTNVQNEISVLQCLKEKHSELMQKKAAIEEQLKEISQSLDGIEEETMVLSSTVEGSKTSPMKTPSQDKIIVPRRKEQEKDEHLRNKDSLMKYTEDTDGNNNKGATSPEDKAAKIQRLKTGFRICKPRGTFLWPNMVPSPGTSGDAATPVHHLEDFLVPTPPSVSSSTNPPLLPCQPTSPVKPLAEKRPVPVATTTAITSVMKPISALKESYGTINLNDVPISYSHHIDSQWHRGLLLGSPHTPSSSASPLTYRRRHNSSPTVAATISRLRSSQWEREIKQGHGHENERQIRGVFSNASVSASSSMPQNTGGSSSWLALATPNPTLPKPTRGHSSPC